MSKTFITVFCISLGINILASMIGAVLIPHTFDDGLFYLIFGNSLLMFTIFPLFLLKQKNKKE